MSYPLYEGQVGNLRESFARCPDDIAKSAIGLTNIHAKFSQLVQPGAFDRGYELHYVVVGFLIHMGNIRVDATAAQRVDRALADLQVVFLGDVFYRKRLCQRCGHFVTRLDHHECVVTINNLRACFN
ncbi:hypothetical protein D3C76_1241010 [compost metagenome]